MKHDREYDLAEMEENLLGTQIEHIQTLEFMLTDVFSPWPEHHRIDLKLEMLSTMIQKPGGWGALKKLFDL